MCAPLSLSLSPMQHTPGAAQHPLLRLLWSDWHTGAEAVYYVAWDGSVTPNADDAIQVWLCFSLITFVL